MKTTNIVLLVSSIIQLAGCAAALVPASSDPARKLGWAGELIDKQNRPLPAEQLIRDAIQIYESKSDEKGLAAAYRQYGIFFRSDAVQRFAAHYRKNGFLDQTVSYDQRFDKAIEYFLKARPFYEKSKTYDLLSNIDLNLAWAYEGKGEQPLACQSLDSSLANNLRFTSTDPDAKIDLPKGQLSFAGAVGNEKTRLRCP
jgi:tetratricopeptide (TPR) repeat protein